MTTFKEGDRVRIVARPATDDDAKSQLYYAHYAGLTGTVQKVYGKQEVSIDIDVESLTREIRKRHEEARDQMKTKWLDGLSEEGRAKLTDREKDFTLRYIVLVAMADLEKTGARKAAPLPAAAETPSPAALGAPMEQKAPEPPHRKTLAELEAAEAEELRRRAQQGEEP